PKDIEKYYPSNYLSFSSGKESLLRKYLLKKRDKYAMTGKGLIGKLLFNRFDYPDFYAWFSGVNIDKNDSILDIGCGNGRLLLKLQRAGFRKLLGIDPFIKEEIVYNKNLRILKKNLSDVQNLSFDWVMLHHVFEHMENPHEAFVLLKKIVKKNGNVLIRIPLVDSYVWQKYKTDWVQLDPPRHYFLHSVKSIKYLSDKYGFKINKIIYDSTSFQIWGSEQYKRQIPLMSNNSFFVNRNASIFSRADMQLYKEQTRELNKNREGDAACFYLQNMN
ncbi:MAG: class I SAM-dependent methyltransferase, partial [Ignavibacteriaceae bacterium]|nr:class I SAM-dependent methyltransferase [Ignavibacteriaceae bacterium]